MIELAKIQVRFADLDTMGHVNNAVYLSYFENARVHYFQQSLLENWDWSKDSVLLVRNEIDYKIPILLSDAPEVHIFLGHVGTKSFEFHYEIRVNDKIYSTGKSVMVCFDIPEQKTIAIPEKMMAALNSLPKHTDRS